MNYDYIVQLERYGDGPEPVYVHEEGACDSPEEMTLAIIKVLNQFDRLCAKKTDDSCDAAPVLG